MNSSNNSLLTTLHTAAAPVVRAERVLVMPFLVKKLPNFNAFLVNSH